MLYDPSRALSGEAARVLRIDARCRPEDAKMALMLMVEKLRLNPMRRWTSPLCEFLIALEKPSYPSGENIRLTFRELYRVVTLRGTDDELNLVAAVASIMGEAPPFVTRRPSIWRLMFDPATA
jgi:hypothetical protein